MKKKVVFGHEGHKKLLDGATILAQAVRSTMGPSGHNVIIDNENGSPYITKDGVTVARSIKLKDKLESVGAELIKEVASKTNEMAGDGPQPLYAKVLTPHGWKQMGELKIGDTICGTHGTYQTVLGTYDKGVMDLYEVKLADGNSTSRSVLCSANHLWEVYTYWGKRVLLTTQELLDRGVKRKSGGANFFIMPTVVNFEEINPLPLDPYLLGVLLGDGSLSKAHEIEISVGLNQMGILNKLVLPEGVYLRTKTYDSKNYIKGTLSGSLRRGKSPQGYKSIIKGKLEDLGLLGTKSHSKFIPKIYMFSSVESRRKLLQGIIDTDGHINSRGLFEFSTVSKQMHLDFIELCRSLGLSTCSYKISRKFSKGSYNSKDIYRTVQLKGNKFGLKIKSVEKLNEKTEMMCIKVSNQDHLYITNDYITTHNTTSSTVLAHSILENGFKQMSSGRSAIELKKGIDLAKEEALSFLMGSAIKCRDAKDIKNVGTISANGDDEIGKLLAEAITSVGPNGLVSIELAKSTHTTLDLAEGMQVDAGYCSPYFVTNAEKSVCEFENPYVLLTTNNISANKDIVSILERILETDRPVVIFADSVEGEALHTLIANKMKGILKVCAVKTPSYGEYRIDILNDIRSLTGGEVIGSASTTSLANMKLEHLGSAKKIVVGKNGTTFIAHDDKADSVKERVDLLRTQLDNPNLDELSLNKLRSRLAKLSGGVAVIRVGGSTEVEILEKKDRVEDAVNATQAAAQEGIVSGGGCALFYTAQHLKKYPALLRNLGKNDDLIAGVEIVISACEAPMKQIVENTGASFEIVKHNLIENQKKYVWLDTTHAATVEKLLAVKDADKILDSEKDAITASMRYGYDAATHKFVDMIDVGIIDPVKVTRYALEHAASIVGLMLTCNSIIVSEEEEE